MTETKNKVQAEHASCSCNHWHRHYGDLSIAAHSMAGRNGNPGWEQVLGVFIGTLYLWTTVDPLWASLFSAGAIGLTATAR